MKVSRCSLKGTSAGRTTIALVIAIRVCRRQKSLNLSIGYRDNGQYAVALLVVTIFNHSQIVRDEEHRRNLRRVGDIPGVECHYDFGAYLAYSAQIVFRVEIRLIGIGRMKERPKKTELFPSVIGVDIPSFRLQ